MKTALRSEERILKEGPANLQRNVETVGGWLYLTNRRLVFEAHRFNVQGGTTEIHLADVTGVDRCWSKFLGFLPVFPNSLAVYTKSGKDFRFVLFRRGAWAAAIQGGIAT